MRQQQHKISLVDWKSAYLLALEFLPRQELWFHAISARRDGSSPEVIFRIFGAIRTEYLARIGDLAAGFPSPAEWSVHVPDASIEDQTLAYSIAISSLPKSDLWRSAIANRQEGSTPEGVRAGLEGIRQLIHARIGTLSNVNPDTTLEKLNS